MKMQRQIAVANDEQMSSNTERRSDSFVVIAEFNGKFHVLNAGMAVKAMRTLDMDSCDL